MVAALILGVAAERPHRRWFPLGVAGVVVATLVLLIATVRTGVSGRLTPGVPGVLSRIAATDFGGFDALRAVQWKASLAAFGEKPMFGFGLENHHLVWSAHFDRRSEELGTDIFDRAHNQYLELLATTGIVGALTFFAIWAAMGYSLYRAFSARRLNVSEFAVLAGGNVAYATYLVFWFVDINAAILWLLLAALIAARSNPVPVLRDSGPSVAPARAGGCPRNGFGAGVHFSSPCVRSNAREHCAGDP